MRKISVLLLLIILLSCIPAANTLGKVEMRRVLVLFRERPNSELIQQHGGRVVYIYDIIPGIACWLPQNAIGALENNPNVEYVEIDTQMSIQPDFQAQAAWGRKTKCIIQMESLQDDGSTLNLGTITFNGATYTLPREISKNSGSYSVLYTPAPNFVFEKWESSGAVNVPNPAGNPTQIIVNGAGTLKAKYKSQSTSPPSPPPSSQVLPWGVDHIDAELAWRIANGTNVQVAIMDTGIDVDHPDLKDNILAGINFVGYWLYPLLPWNPGAWDDDNGHGTWCAGIVGAVDNTIGVLGVAPRVDLIAVKVLDSSGSGYISDIVAGIDWCVDNRIEVISMSFGGPSDSYTLHEACDNAYLAGVVLVAASGNSGDGNPSTNNVNYPAKYSSVIAVSAVDLNDAVPSFSSDGAEVDFAAPGVSVYSTWRGGGYATHSGTSAACPHVSGAIALFIKQDIKASPFSALDQDNDGKWDPKEVYNWLKSTADDKGTGGYDVLYGWGVVDAEEAATGHQTNP